MAQLRTFVAIGLPAEARAYLERRVSDLADLLPKKSVRWVPPQNLHVTLRFLGDTEHGLLSRIATALDRATQDRPELELHLDKLGCFPNPRRPRVIWIGLGGELDAMSDLQRSIERSLAPLGWAPERRPFHPHLTLGRVKDSRRVVEARLPWGERFEPHGWRVGSVHLIESQLRPEGAVYSRRHTSRLGNSEAQS